MRSGITQMESVQAKEAYAAGQTIEQIAARFQVDEAIIAAHVKKKRGRPPKSEQAATEAPPVPEGSTEIASDDGVGDDNM